MKTNISSDDRFSGYKTHFNQWHAV